MICRCQEIMRSEIEKAIQEGATTVDGVKRRTRAGMGLCQGKTCQRLVQRILQERTGADPAELLPGNVRPPVRPVDLRVIAEDADEY